MSARSGRGRTKPLLVGAAVVFLIAGITVLGALRLGLLTFAGVGPATVRFAAADATGTARQWSFDQEADGMLPAGAESLMDTVLGGWVVRREADTPSPPMALCQTGTAEYPAITLGTEVYADVAVRVRFKPISGRVDQAAGIIFRVQDRANYLVVRANALEHNVNLYRYTGSRRSIVQEGPKTVPSGQWQELRVEAIGDRITAFLDGQQVLTATESTFRAGRIGLWTKADSTTCFDDLEVQPLP